MDLAVEFRHSELDLVRDSNDHPIWNVANAAAILTHHSEWCDVLAYDEFVGQNVLLKPVPDSQILALKETFAPKSLADVDLTAIQIWFNRNGFPKATRSIVTDAAFIAAQARIINPCRHYLEGLKWDGVERISYWLTEYCGVDADSSVYVR